MPPNKKTSLSMGMDYTSDPESFEERTEWPPRTPAEGDADRATWDPPYGSAQVPPAPQWYLDADGNPVSGGWQTSREVMLNWHSGVGEAAGSGSYSGTAGLDLAGITGHYLYIAEGADPLPTTPSKTVGPLVNTVVDGLQPNTEYRFAVAAFNASDTGPKSEILSVRTQPAAAA
ncbi:fibronectin type III domain-containing protein [Streptomyces xanthophaeus]|uniref:fibronectin type III domain-containing protein n=1 Tax=Streptomyces xanthophaeus TaxID=67385 RepID=UPI003433613C